MDRGAARRMWSLFEPIHDVAYFTPEVQQAADTAGMRGFWMCYFAMRLAPLGPVGTEVATAVCHGFHPDRVRRALPDAWDRATPAEVLAARLGGVDAALRRIWGAGVVESETVHEAADLAWAAAVGADCAGRPLGAANQGLPRPEKPHLALWQATTTLREHRGDGHIAVLVTHQVGPVAAHLLKAAADESDSETVRIGRQWPEQDWTPRPRIPWYRGAFWIRTDGWPGPGGTCTGGSRRRPTPPPNSRGRPSARAGPRRLGRPAGRLGLHFGGRRSPTDAERRRPGRRTRTD